MFEWFIEVILILVILVQYYFSKKTAGPGELPDRVRDSSRTGSGTAFGPSGKEGNELTAYCWPVKLIGGPALKL